MRGSIQERFDAKWMPEPYSGCWLWTDHDNGNGYGQIQINHSMCVAHRLSWTLHYGPIPKGLKVLHRCDTPSCVNPSHLFLGTQQDNMLDGVRKKRVKPPALKGERHGQSKLLDSQISTIRKDGRTQSKIAADYGISQTLISQIKLRKIWRHIP